MKLENYQFVITDHAYERYCERVKETTRESLAAYLSNIKTAEHNTRDYVQMDGIWWRYELEGNEITLHTCYGEHHIDLPQAIRWAKRYGDRLALGD